MYEQTIDRNASHRGEAGRHTDTRTERAYGSEVIGGGEPLLLSTSQ